MLTCFDAAVIIVEIYICYMYDTATCIYLTTGNILVLVLKIQLLASAEIAQLGELQEFDTKFVGFIYLCATFLTSNNVSLLAY